MSTDFFFYLAMNFY